MESILDTHYRIARDVELCQHAGKIPKARNVKEFWEKLNKETKTFTILLYDESFDKMTTGLLPSCSCGCHFNIMNAQCDMLPKKLNEIIWGYSS